MIVAIDLFGIACLFKFTFTASWFVAVALLLSLGAWLRLGLLFVGFINSVDFYSSLLCSLCCCFGGVMCDCGLLLRVLLVWLFCDCYVGDLGGECACVWRCMVCLLVACLLVVLYCVILWVTLWFCL